MHAIDLCTDVVGGGGVCVPLRLATQTLNYMLVHECTGASVCVNTQRQLWGGHWGLIEDRARAPPR